MQERKEAFGTWRWACAFVALVAIPISWFWPGVRITCMFVQGILMGLLWSRFVWVLSSLHLKRPHVAEIRSNADLEEALSLYDHMMPVQDRHPVRDIKRWWAEEQKRKPDDCESREIFLFAKAEGWVCWILFATHSRNFLNVYGFARCKFNPPTVNKDRLESELLDAICQIVDCLPNCNGMLIEISDKISVRERAFNKKLHRFGMKLEPVTTDFILPDLTRKRDRKTEKQATLYYVPKDGGKRFDLHSASDRDFLIRQMYGIYADSYLGDPLWLAYIADLERRVLAEVTAA